MLIRTRARPRELGIAPRTSPDLAAMTIIVIREIIQRKEQKRAPLLFLVFPSDHSLLLFHSPCKKLNNSIYTENTRGISERIEYVNSSARRIRKPFFQRLTATTIAINRKNAEQVIHRFFG